MNWPFNHYKITISVMFFMLKYILSDTNVATLASFCLVLA